MLAAEANHYESVGSFGTNFHLSPTCSEVREAENCPNLPVLGDTPSYKPPVQRVMLSTLLKSIFL